MTSTKKSTSTKEKKTKKPAKRKALSRSKTLVKATKDMKSDKRKDTPINIRAKSSQRNKIDQAAALTNKSRSDFMLEAACKEADNILLEQRLFVIDEENYELFLKQLDAPVKKNKALKALLESPSPWEK